VCFGRPGRKRVRHAHRKSAQEMINDRTGMRGREEEKSVSPMSGRGKRRLVSFLKGAFRYVGGEVKGGTEPRREVTGLAACRREGLGAEKREPREAVREVLSKMRKRENFAASRIIYRKGMMCFFTKRR